MGWSRPILQSEAAECGLACVAMVARHHGHKIDLNGLRQRFSVSLKGATLRDLMQIADALGFGARALRLEMERLKDLAAPAILHWNMNHFVVLKAVGRKKITILDPARGEIRLSHKEVSNHFTGVALELTPAADFKPIEARTRTKFTSLWTRLTGLKRSIIQILVLSVMMQLFVLIAPFYIQLVIDESVTRFDRDLLLVLALGFGFLYGVNAIAELVRSWVILVLGQSMTFQMAGNILRHLMRLPAAFFEKRHVGDIISRIGSIEPIQNALTQGVVAALIDGAMMLATVSLMFVFSWRLALIAVAFTAAYLVVTLAIFPFMRLRQEEMISSRAREQTHVIETIRAARAVKLFGRETERESAWRNYYADVINAALSFGKLEMGSKFASTLLFGLQTVLIVYVGARTILSGEMTLGMLFAFLAYRQSFADRTMELVNKGVEFRMLGLHLDRLSDIVQANEEDGLAAPVSSTHHLRGAINLDRASFRYAASEPAIFENLSLAIEPGEFVAIAGPSGGGKTTLLKVMLGLLDPQSGEARVDGVSLRAYGLRNWRADIGVVMQDDALLTGTIADNISFFDPEIDMERVVSCAAQALIHEDITRMPMNYLSFIGDMGAALSGGQRQRLLLARALYQRPKALFLDEGTANLDEATEKKIADAVSAMPITRVIVAHRRELISRADRVFDMIDGRLIERRTAEVSEIRARS